MTEFIALTVKSSDLTKLTKLAININNIIQFYNLEPNDTGTKIIIVDGAKSKELYASESYEDILRALNVRKVLNEQDRNQLSYEVHSPLYW